MLIDIPLDKGLRGNRAAFIRATDRGRIIQVQDIGGLRQLQIGIGEQWSDVAICSHNGIAPLTARNYESLPQMLEHGRVDLFPRPATGIFAEYDTYKHKYANLAIDKHLLLNYPSATHIQIFKSAPRLADRIRHGLREMQKDGSFDGHFEKYFSQVIARLNLPRRKLVKPENALLPA